MDHFKLASDNGDGSVALFFHVEQADLRRASDSCELNLSLADAERLRGWLNASLPLIAEGMSSRVERLQRERSELLFKLKQIESALGQQR
jgi:hypothetical protein